MQTQNKWIVTKSDISSKEESDGEMENSSDGKDFFQGRRAAAKQHIRYGTGDESGI